MAYSILMGEQGRQVVLDKLQAEVDRETAAHPIEATEDGVVTRQQASDNAGIVAMLLNAASRAKELINHAGEQDLISLNLSGNCGELNRQQVETEHFYVGIQKLA